MSSFKSLRPTPAMFVAVAALVMAMSGAAIALPGKNSVDSSDLAKGSVTARAIAKSTITSKQIEGKSIKGNRIKDAGVSDKQLKDGAVTEAKIADGAVTSGKIAAGAVTAASVGDGTLSTKNLSDDAVVSSAAGSFVKLTATDGADEATARAAAPATTLFAKGDITVTAKCFRDTGGDETFGEIYVATATNGAVFNATDSLQGGNAATDFLNTDTDPTDRVLDSESATGNDAAYNENEFTILAPDGTSLIGQTSVGAKNGTLAGGNGVYGEGNVCVFGAELAG